MRVALFVIVALAACGKKKATPREDVAAAPDLFVIASPRVTDAPVPARFTAPLPATVDELARPQRTPPGPVITAGLRAGDRSMQEKVVAALERAAAGGAIPEEVAGYYAGLVGYAPTEVECAWLRDLATGTRPAAVRAWAWTPLAECPGKEMAEVFARADAPDDAVIEWYFDRFDGERLPYTQRLVDAAAAIARTGDDYSIRRIGFAFAITGDPRALDAVIALQRSQSDPKRRALIALGLQRHPSPEARAFGKAACADLAGTPEAMCSDAPSLPFADDAPAPDAPERDAALEARLTELGFARRADAPPVEEPATYASGILVERGWGMFFDMETGQFPNEHDALLADLARLVHPALDGVVFEERPPTLDPTSGETRGPYELRAYADGKRYELLAKDNGDWYDVPAVLGLLNALLVARGSDHRFIAVDVDGQGATIIGGPMPALRALADAKLVDVALP